MKVSKYIEYLSTGDVSKLAISDVGDMSINPVSAPTSIQLTNQARLVNYINLANLAVHKRFHLKEGYVELDNPLDGEEFKLPSDFLVPLNAYYTEDNEDVTIKDSSIKMVDKVDTAVSILLPESFLARIKGTDVLGRSQITMRYAAAPKIADKASVDLGVSQVYTEAIINYAAYKAHSAVSGKMDEENNTYYLRYESSCKQIVTSGMWGNNEIETNTKLQQRGFV